MINLKTTIKTSAISLAMLASVNASADIQHLDDVIISFSLCVGNDCVNGESFGFDTIRMKENNIRIKAQDTSTSASFPTNDWQITFNDSSNGGANKFSIDDIDGGRTPFTIEAGARSNSLYVENDGDVGFGTSSPVVNLHVVDGNTPTLRLEQDGSSGFTPQTWDVAGNEAGFFVRDATNGSTLPFRILPGAASQALVIDGNSDVGIGAGTNPSASLHIKRTDATGKLLIEDTSASFSTQVELIKNGTPRIRFDNSSNTTAAAATDAEWDMGLDNSHNFILRNFDTESNVFSITSTGALTIGGTITTTGGTCGTGCDKVFDKTHELPSIEEHAMSMWSNQYLPNVGPTIENEPFDLTDKVGRMLNELETAHIYIENLHRRIESLEEKTKLNN